MAEGFKAKIYLLFRNIDENALYEDDENGNDNNMLNGTIKSMDGAKSMIGTKAPLTQSQIALKKKREALEAMHEAAFELFNHFNHKNLDALIKLVKFTLEKLRKRITASQAILAYNEARNKGLFSFSFFFEEE